MKISELRSNVPEGKSGDWAIGEFSVTEDDVKIHNMRCMFQPGMGGRVMIPGDYTKLTRRGAIIMSDTRAEMRDLLPLYYAGHGLVLINGLGLGMALQIMLARPEVEHVTVIEKSPDVIKLVAPTFAGERCEIIEADAYEWSAPKGLTYDAVWHDIWDDICADNLPGMHKLHRRYGRKSEWQGSWCRDLCEMR